MPPSIKVKAFAVLLDRARSRHLVWVSEDPTKTPPTIHRLLGGHVEFGERAVDAVRREIDEELGVMLGEVAFLGVVENVFTYAGQPRHEVVFVYVAEVADELVPHGGRWFDDGGPIWVEWRSVHRTTDIPLYPAGVQGRIDTWLGRPSPTASYPHGVELEFSGPVWHWRGPSPFHFVSVPEAEAAQLEAVSGLISYGWGMIPATVRIGATEFTTALYPKDGGYAVPLKDRVRRAEDIAVGDTVSVRLIIAV